MFALGIQSLTTCLSVMLVLATGALIGGIAITTWDALVEDARRTGDDGVSRCLASGKQDIHLVSGGYLHAVVRGVVTGVIGYLQVPEKSLVKLSHYAKAYHPNVSTSPAFIDNAMRTALRAEFESVYPHGIAQVMYEALPWSDEYPHQYIPGASDFTPWGGTLVYLLADSLTGRLPSSGRQIPLVYESRDGVTGDLGSSVYTFFGESDASGRMTNAAAPCDRFVDWDMGERMGSCRALRNVTESGIEELSRRLLGNMFSVDAPLMSPDMVHYAPVTTLFHQMVVVVSMSFTHPGMRNITPRQNGRVGQVSAIIDTLGVNDVVNKQILPLNTLLYIVERNPWDGRIGSLIAFNKGRFLGTKMQRMGPPYDRDIEVAEIINVTRHSMGDSGAANASGQGVSVIAEHSRFVLNRAGGFEGMEERTRESFFPWNATNGTEYWTVTSTVRYHSLVWYVNLLTPRHSVMESIDKSISAIWIDASNARQDSRDRQKRAFITIFAVTSAVVSVLLLVSVVFTRIIVAPLHALARDMAEVAVMNLEAIDFSHRAPSRLSEVAAMQLSFDRMVENLTEYRNYIPLSLLVKGEEDEVELQPLHHHEMSLTSPTSNQNNNAIFSSVGKDSVDTIRSSDDTGSLSRSGSEGTFSGSMGMSPRQSFSRSPDGLKRRSISVSYLNVKDWHEFCKSKPDPHVVAAHCHALETVISFAQQFTGVLDVFSGDRMMVTFNAFRPLTGHKSECLKFALGVAKRVLSDGTLVLSFACASGDSRIGSMGCSGMKKITITSNIVPWVVVLERYNRKHGMAGVADQYIARELLGQYILKCVDGLTFPKRCAKSPIEVYEVMEECPVVEEEWMYQLERAGNSPFKVWNEVFSALVKGDYHRAQTLLDSVDSSAEQFYLEIRGVVESGTWEPTVVELH